MTSQPKISIVIPSYNQAHFLPRTLDSIISQNYPNLELIIIDGGSTDGTQKVLEHYDAHIHYWVSEPDRGQSHALNKGFAQATGEIFAWQNSDDLYLPGTFAAIIAAFMSNPGNTIIYGDYLTVDENERILNYQTAFDFDLKHFIYEGFHVNAQATFWHREVHERFGLFNEELHRTMDYDMLLRFALNEPPTSYLRLNRPLACFRRHEHQKTQGMDSTVLKEHRIIAANNNTGRFSWKGPLMRPQYRLRRAYWYWRRGGIKYLTSQFAKNRIALNHRFRKHTGKNIADIDWDRETE